MEKRISEMRDANASEDESLEITAAASSATSRRAVVEGGLDRFALPPPTL